jgi:hypothetical protein
LTGDVPEDGDIAATGLDSEFEQGVTEVCDIAAAGLIGLEQRCHR